VDFAEDGRWVTSHRWAHHRNSEVESTTTVCEVDPSVEAMQITVPVVESQGRMEYLVNEEEQRVDDEMDTEGVELRDEKKAAEGQMAITERKYTAPVKTGGDAEGWGHEYGRKGMGSEHTAGRGNAHDRATVRPQTDKQLSGTERGVATGETAEQKMKNQPFDPITPSPPPSAC